MLLEVSSEILTRCHIARNGAWNVRQIGISYECIACSWQTPHLFPSRCCSIFIRPVEKTALDAVFYLTGSITSCHRSRQLIKSMEYTVHLENMIVTQLVEIFQKFITVFTKDRHWIVSWVRWIHFPPYSFTIYSNIDPNLCLGLPTGLFPSDLPTKMLMYLAAKCFSCFILLKIIVMIFGE
jgi:hypothetical protein